MKQYWQFLRTKYRLKTVLVAFFLSLLPARNYYYSLDLGPYRPVVRPAPFEIKTMADYPVNLTKVSAPFLVARAAVVIDVSSKAILFEKNPDLRLLPASTTKIMTALVALENYDLNEAVTITSVEQTGQKMDLKVGERITIANLLYGLLVQSANDAATALAQHFPAGEDGFIAAMNQKAESLGLNSSQFTNAVGLDAYGHYTTSHDLALLAAYAMANPTFAKMVATEKITVTDVSGTISHELETINELLGEVSGLAGVKTGWTELAGECLVTYVKRQNRAIITVVLGSNDRFGETRRLIDWVFTYFEWQALPEASRW